MVKVRISLIVMQTENGFRKPTKLIIILRITKVKNNCIKGLSRVEVHQYLQHTLNYSLGGNKGSSTKQVISNGRKYNHYYPL